jgi:hypothetical protein
MTQLLSFRPQDDCQLETVRWRLLSYIPPCSEPRPQRSPHPSMQRKGRDSLHESDVHDLVREHTARVAFARNSRERSDTFPRTVLREKAADCLRSHQGGETSVGFPNASWQRVRVEVLASRPL